MQSLLQRLADPRIVRGCQIVMGVVFVWAAVAKIGDPTSFASQIHNFRILPIPLENLAAMTLPWIELFAGIAMIIGVHRRAASILVAAMMIVFTLAVIAAVARGLSIECGCFGTASSSKTGLKKILENSGMIVVSLIATLRPRVG